MADRNEPVGRLDDFRRPDGHLRLRDIAHLQSIIIVHSGAEEYSSAPTSFESLRSKALPLDRTDFDGEPDFDVIRVPWPDAVRFVVDLEKREDVAGFGEMKKPNIDRSLSDTCQQVSPEDGGFCDDQHKWADEHIAAAEKHGYEHCVHTRDSIRGVQAEMNNELYIDLTPWWFAPRWIDYEGELGEQR